MDEAKLSKRIKVMQIISEDMEKDAKDFNGKPFNGKTVGEYFGNQGAAIAALADNIKRILEDMKGEN